MMDSRSKDWLQERRHTGGGKEEGEGGNVMMDAEMAAMMGFEGFSSSKKQTSWSKFVCCWDAFSK